jgi:hypothetical protein
VGDGDGGPDSDGKAPDDGGDGFRAPRIVPAMIPAVSSMTTTTKVAHPKAARPPCHLLGC